MFPKASFSTTWKTIKATQINATPDGYIIIGKSRGGFFLHVWTDHGWTLAEMRNFYDDDIQPFSRFINRKLFPTKELAEEELQSIRAQETLLALATLGD